MYQYDHNLGPYFQVQQWLRKKRFEQMRHGCNAQGWLLMVYFGVMVGSIFLVGLGIGFWRMVTSIAQYGHGEVTVTLEEIMYYSGWGNILACVIGFVLLLLWKKPAYLSDTVFVRNRPLKPVRFVQILSLFMTVQLVHLLLGALVESALNQVGLTAQGAEGYTADGWSIFLYTAAVAPVAEEILFRGLILRSLAPYGKKFAIFASSLLFGLFHGNLEQGLFAFSAGLVLGYVTLEHHIIWAMVLHIFNNLMIADTLSRLSQLFAPEQEKLVRIGVLGAFGLVAMVTLALNYSRIGAYLRKQRNEPGCYKALRTAPGIITLVIVMLILILNDLSTSIVPI